MKNLKTMDLKRTNYRKIACNKTVVKESGI
jgi:hypothetical protein